MESKAGFFNMNQCRKGPILKFFHDLWFQNWARTSCNARMFSPFCQTCPGGNGPFPGQPKKKKKVCPFQAPKTTKNGPSWRSAESCTVLQSTNRGYGGWVTKKGDAESRCARYLDIWSYHVFIVWSIFPVTATFVGGVLREFVWWF